MPPVPPSTTTRYKVGYSGPFHSHHMLFHGEPTDTAATLAAKAAAVLAPMALLCFNGVVFNTAQFAAAGSPFFFPDGSWTPITSASGINPSAASNPGQFLEFGGRAPADGVRVKLYQFETFFGNSADMRYNRGESAAVDAALNALQAFGLNLATISGSIPTWYDYANVKANDYYTHRAR
jgi:hypothetical protein